MDYKQTDKIELPEWWPENPYPESVWPMDDEEYTDAIPDGRKRCAISGYLGRSFWDIATRSIFHSWKAHREEEIEEAENIIREFIEEIQGDEWKILLLWYRAQDRSYNLINKANIFLNRKKDESQIGNDSKKD